MTLPYARNSETSREAAQRAVGKAERDKDRLRSFIRIRGKYGSTREEAEKGIPMKGNTLRPRWIDLMREQSIVKTCRKRPTDSGNAAEVFVWVPPETRQMEIGL